MDSNMETNLISLNHFVPSSLNRRDLLRLAARSTIGLAATGTLRAQSAGVIPVPFGSDTDSFTFADTAE
jgi:hypothetical protein